MSVQKVYPTCQLACATELERSIERIGAEHIAAFIAEPIIGAAGGAVVPPKEYYKVIKDICSHYDILFIADEVMTGLGRTGAWFAMEHWGVEPDIMTLGKGLGAWIHTDGSDGCKRPCYGADFTRIAFCYEWAYVKCKSIICSNSSCY